MMTSSPTSRRSRPTSAPSVDDMPYSSSSIHMQRSSSADQNRVSKRKGTRSVSTLTPAQLARKRANDREAQRAIRARTKEHIERLEAELDEMRSVHSRDHAVQELLRRNRMLEDQLKSLRDSMGLPSGAYASSTTYSTPGALASPRTSPYPPGPGDFGANAGPPPGALPDYTSAYVPFGANPAPAGAGNNCENWAAAVSASVPSNVSSPCSSATDEYGAGPAYLPTSAPNPMVQSPATAGLRHEEIKMEYEDGNDHGFHLEDRRSNSSAGSNMGTPPMNAMSHPFMLPQQHHAAWPPHSNMYYAALQPPVY